MRLSSPVFRIKRQFLSALLVVLVAITALGGSFGSQPAAAQDVQTRAIIVHGASDLGKVEVSFNGNEVVDDLEYGDQTEWIDLDPGAVEVWISRDRVGFNYTVFGAVYPVPAGNDYYLVITDALVMGGTFDKSPLAADAARIQVTHGSVDTPAVNVVANGDEINLATQLAYARTSDAVEVPTGTYGAEVRMADTGEVLVTTTGGAVAAGKVYQYILIGTPGSEDHPLEFIVLETDAQTRAE